MSARMFEILCDYYEGRIHKRILDERLSEALLLDEADRHSADWMLCQSVLLNEKDTKDIEVELRSQSSNDLRRTLLHMSGLTSAYLRHTVNKLMPRDYQN